MSQSPGKCVNSSKGCSVFKRANVTCKWQACAIDNEAIRIKNYLLTRDRRTANVAQINALARTVLVFGIKIGGQKRSLKLLSCCVLFGDADDVIQEKQQMPNIP